ncbi:hypothetical protein [Aliivibrio fischeri]|uniref:hypothetical protein n=1 Tax=Aliivibrio fischeri TaxID=668 RepID=UPI00080E9C5D|nr:hypothetical protein [Aliivibrio fischeri]OCH29986.1 hypothetical protein A6D99_18810 [Aliivibrio fischeri]
MSIDYDFSEIIVLDEELLSGAVLINEWCVTIIREADIAYVSGAYLGAILTAVSGIETHMRSELDSKSSLVNLINESEINESLKQQLHAMRKYRNQWVHVDSLDNEFIPLTFADELRDELKLKAYESIKLLRKVIYARPWI